MGKRLTHEEFLDRLLQINKHYASGELIVVGQYNGSNKPIECYCNVHKVKWSPIPNNLWKGCGCLYCGGMYVLMGFNDMWTVRPDVASM